MRLDRALRALLATHSATDGAERVVVLAVRRGARGRRALVYWIIPPGASTPSGAELVGTLEEVRRAASGEEATHGA